MKEKIFVDTNIFVNLLLGKNVEKIIQILEDDKNELATCTQVLNEIKYIFLIKSASSELNSEKKYDILKYIKGNSVFRSKTISKYNEFYYKIITSAEVFTVNKEIDNLSDRYIVRDGLLPSDAVIAAIMEKNGIKRIFSTDSDFDNIDWINRVGL
jgi:predicted nucleic acid-binding protein